MHVNGDSLFARILVNRLKPLLQHCKVLFCAPRTHGTVFHDLGIDQVDITLPKNAGQQQYIRVNNVLYVDVWIGWAKSVCVFCLKNVVDHFNGMLATLENLLELPAPPHGCDAVRRI